MSKMIDFHNHYTNWKQTGSDFRGLIEAMDKAGVSESAIFGLPTVFSDDGYKLDTRTDRVLLEKYRELDKEMRERLHPFICAINPGNEMAAEYVKNMIEEFKWEIFGIGEVLCRHDEMSIKVMGKEIPPNTPAMMKIYDLAAGYGLPVLLHSNVTKPGSSDFEYLDEINDACEHNRDCEIVWAHAGISEGICDLRLKKLLEVLADVFERHKNLSVDLSWRVFDYYIGGHEKDWAELIEKYPRRFLLGTDRTGHWEEYVNIVRRYDTLVEKLSDGARQKVLKDNARRLIGKADKELEI